MGIKLVLFISIINGLFSYNLFEAAPINESSLIVNIILNDSNTCANKSVIHQSKYLQQACNIGFPEILSDIKNNTNINQYLCIALYDRSVKVCHLQATEKKDLFTNQTIFDDEVNKIITNFKQLYSVCANWQNNLISEYNITKPFVSKLNHYLEDPKICIDKCSDEISGKTSTIKPLCAMVYYIDEKMKMNQTDSKKTINKDISNVTPKLTGTDNVSKSENAVTSKETISTIKQNSEKEKNNNEEKKADTPIVTNVDAGTSKNEGAKSDLKNPGDKTTLQVNDLTSKVDETSQLDKKEENTNTAVEKPDTIVDQTMMNVEDNIQHAGGDFIPAEESDRIPIDDEDKINDQDPLVKPDDKTDNLLIRHNIEKDDDAHFFGYFTILGLLGIGGCIAYHHKQKILAILLEGRRSRGGRGRRRPSTASYRKLDCTLEEAVTSQCNANVTHVIY